MMKTTCHHGNRPRQMRQECHYSDRYEQTTHCKGMANRVKVAGEADKPLRHLARR